jgi:ATP-binding cassette subfamily F protein 3
MPLLELRGVSKDWGLEPIFSGVNLRIEEGDKLGLLGPNGSGKTSLLRVIMGIDGDFRGQRTLAPGTRVAYVPQRCQLPEGPSCVEVLIDEAARLKRRLEALADSLQAEAAPCVLEEYGEVSARFEALGGEGAMEGARRLLSQAGLGAVADSPACRLSGGEKNLLSLATALASNPDILLLDEPGNHLDFPGLSWLEQFIRAERRAVILVSHNRALLDRTVERILALEDGQAQEHAGGYSAYRMEKLARAAGQGREWQADRKRLERLEALVERFAQIAAAHPDPAWGKRLRARKSQLEREKEAMVQKPSTGPGRIEVSFKASDARADYALVARDYSLAFGERRLIEPSSFDLLCGERAALVGPNGSGKTSFLRELVGCGELPAEERWDPARRLRVGPSMRIGYCAQEQEIFRADRTVGQEFSALGAGEDECHRLLKRYLFGRSILDAKVASLSGGELNRLQIARAVFLGSNFLVLDEPTNHLDIESREALEEGLSDFSGTILAVSHDSWFLEKVADRIIGLEERRLVCYEGSFAEYWRDLHPAGIRVDASAGMAGRASAIGRRGPEARRGGAPKGATGRGEQIERRITELEGEKEGLERLSSSLSAQRDFKEAGRAAQKAKSLDRILSGLYREWEAMGN